MATDILDIEINIGANTQDLGAELQKAENLLTKLQSKLKKSTDVGEIQKLNTKISSVESSIGTLNTRMNALGRPTNDATNALSNLSRVAQDAPYGFIGIANNLNPLLESFQRLQTRSGSATEALKSMAAGLVGPAGIGLALGVVSSLAVTFSDEIAEFFIGPTEKLKKFREELNKLNQDIYKIVGEAQSNRTIGLNLVNIISGGNPTQQQEALKRLKALYSDNKAIKDATIQSDKAYLVHLINVAAIQEDAAGKEKNTQQILASAYAERKKLIAQRDADLSKVTASGGSAEYNKNKADKERERIAKGYNLLITDLDSVINKAKIKNAELLNTLTNIETTGGVDLNKQQESDLQIMAKLELDATERWVAKLKAKLKESQQVLKNERIKLFSLPSETREEDDKRKNYFEKQAKDLLEKTQKEGGFGAYMQGIFKKDKNQIDSEAAEKKRIEDLTQSYAQFAQTLSSNVTNALFGMYDAMQQGQNPLEALANAFLQIGKNIAAMVIQALIFEKIMNAFPALKGAFAALGLVGNALSGARVAGSIINSGNANSSFNPSSVANNNASQGQFVLKGSDLVLATQRANNNLNIRRGY
jgi:hypothetical protein